MHFFERLEQLSEQKGSLLCIGLDPDPRKLPSWTSDDPNPVLAFNRHIIDLTCDLAIAYKPNAAFYEALGPNGWQTLSDTIKYAHKSGVPVILDAKRSDIGSTASAYAVSAFEKLHADAITVNPYMGWDSVEPFLRYADRGIFVLTLSSNPGAQDFQCADSNGHPLYQRVAEQCVDWNDGRQNVGMVVGATYADEVCCVRAISKHQWLLVPGVGAQGGDLALALDNGLREDGSGVLVNVSRAVMYAEDPREAAMQLRDEIEVLREVKRRKTEDHPPEPKRLADDPNLVDLALALYDIGAVQFGEYTLHSGQQSPFYIDLRLLISNPNALGHAARAYTDLLNELYFDRLAAIPYAGIPLATAIAMQVRMPMIYPRKEVKDYGTSRAIEGSFERGEMVAVIDDLISNGASKITAIEQLRMAGLRVRDVVVLLDREGPGRQQLADAGYTLHSVFRLRELMDVLLEHKRITLEQREIVDQFLNEQPEVQAV